MNIEKTALVVIDLQNGITSLKGEPYTSKEVIENTAKLVSTFTAKGGFVVLVKVSSLDGKDMLAPIKDTENKIRNWTEGFDSIVPELAEIQGTHTITKRQWGAFYGTELDLQLRRRGVDTIILCGISTEIGVDTTAREAYQRGYNQIFVEDAMTASSKEAHEYVVKCIFPRIGQVRSTEEVTKLIESL